jgi:hypothetical protein
VQRWAPLLTAIAVFAAFPTGLGTISALSAGVDVSGTMRRIRNRRLALGIAPMPSRWICAAPDAALFTRHPIGMDRVLGQSEVGMGGPIEQEWLLAHGAIVEGVSSQRLNVADRFRVAMADARHNATCVVYDAEAHAIYRCQTASARQRFDQLVRALDTA